MVKAEKKTNPKKETAKTKDANVAKQHKIVKKTKSSQPAVKKSNPSAGAAKGQKSSRTPVEKSYFNVHEDHQIYEAWKNNVGLPVSNVAKNLHSVLGRSVESVRDRLKRYITKMNVADQKELQNAAKKNPKFYIHFKTNVDKTKKIEKIVSIAPALHNRDLKRRPRVSKKKESKNIKKVVPPDEKFKWVSEKLANKDAYFKLEFSVQLLSDILNSLIQNDQVTAGEVEKFISGVHFDQNLTQILDHFIKKNK